jgi:hypothetical protein
MFRDPRLVLVIAVAVGLWMPLARMEWFWGHERISYVLRTVEWASALKSGELYPRWCSDFYGGYGSPLFVFYGPVIYGIAGVLTATFLDPFWALKVVVLLGSLISGIGTFALVFGETRQGDAALLGSVAYLAAPYRIGNVYDRGDIGEFSCIALLPVAIALYRAFAFEPRPRPARRLLVAAAVVHALVIMTHPVLGLWGTVVIGVVVVATAIGLTRRRLTHRALLLIAAISCAPGLAAIYVIPAMAYRGATHTAAAIVGFYNPLDHWIPIKTLFLASIPLFPRNFLQIGPLVVAASVAVLVGLLVNVRRGRPLRSGIGWLVLSFALICLTLSIGSGFWAPGRIPLAAFIQFPWRLLGPAALAASVALGIGTAAIFERASDSMRGGAVMAGAAILILGLAWPFVSTNEMKIAGIPADPNSIRQGMYSATDADEYLPLTAIAPPAAPRTQLVARIDGADVQTVHSEDSHHALTVRALRGNATVLLALHGFPGWKVRSLSGPKGATLDTDPRGLVRIHLPTPGVYNLRVWFGSSPASQIGSVVSLVSALMLCLLLVHGSRFWRGPIPVARPVDSPP